MEQPSEPPQARLGDTLHVTYGGKKYFKAKVIAVQLGAEVPNFTGDDRRDKLVHHLQWADDGCKSWAMLLPEHHVAQPRGPAPHNYEDAPLWSFSQPLPAPRKGKAKAIAGKKMVTK